MATIKTDGKARNIGRFDDLMSAVRAYDEACIMEHGDFAKPNYPASAYGLAGWDMYRP